jgi:RNA polymerase sigma factor (sigma-70 family)
LVRFKFEVQDLFRSTKKARSVLTKEQERALIRKVRDGNRYAARNPLWPAYLYDSKTVIKNAQEARGQLLETFYPLVVSIATRMCAGNLNVDFRDAIGCGIEGLLIAIDRFDLHTTNRLSTYAVPWIRKHVFAFLREESSMTASSERTADHARIDRERRRLAQLLSRQPLQEELAEALKITESQLQRLLAKGVVSLHSLDAPISRGSTLSLKDTVVNEDALWFRHTTLSDVEKGEILIALRSAMSRLHPLERTVIGQLYGIGAKVTKTVPEIAKGLGASWQKVREIEASALSKLRRQEVIRQLRVFVRAESRDSSTLKLKSTPKGVRKAS